MAWKASAYSTRLIGRAGEFRLGLLESGNIIREFDEV
jgi:hypothetical protein